MASCGAMKKGAGNFIVDSVNPKFKAYDRPICLAIAIGGLTVLCTAALFLLLLQDCHERTVSGSDLMDVNQRFKKGDVGVCIYYVALTKFNNGNLHTEQCQWPEYAEQKPPGICDSDGIDYDSLPKCYTDYHAEYSTPNLILYKECPEPLATLGAAMGYTAFIELFFTGIIIFPCLKCGFLKNGADSSEALSVKEWVMQMYENKDAGAEIGKTMIGSTV